MVLVVIAGPRVDRLRRVHDRLQHLRVVRSIHRMRLILNHAADRLLDRLLNVRFEHTLDFRTLLANCRRAEEGVSFDS